MSIDGRWLALSKRVKPSPGHITAHVYEIVGDTVTHYLLEGGEYSYVEEWNVGDPACPVCVTGPSELRAGARPEGTRAALLSAAWRIVLLVTVFLITWRWM